MQSWIHVIEWRANVRPDVTALVDDRGAAYTTAQLLAATERAAGGWAAAGVRPGEVVARGAGQLRRHALSEETVVRFFAALEAGDIETLREIYAPDAVIWHNDDLIEQPVEDNLKVLRGLHRAVSGLRYDIVRRVATADGVLQQHVLRGSLQDGAEVELHAAMYLQVRDGRVTRIEEYLDSAKRSSIRAAREALPG